MTSLALQVYNRFWELIRDEDYEGIRRLLADDFELHLPGQPSLPADDAIVMAQVWRNAFSNFGATQQHIKTVEAQDGLTVALVVYEEVTHDGTFEFPNGPNFPASHNQVRVESNHMFEVTSDGEMLAWYIQFDTQTLFAQMGAPATV